MWRGQEPNSRPKPRANGSDADRSRTTQPQPPIAGVPEGSAPRGKIAKPARGEAGLKASKQPTPAWHAGLAPALLAAAPPLLEPLHEAEPRLVPAAVPAAPTALAYAPPLTHAARRTLGTCHAPAADYPAHVPPTGQRPHGTGEHDQEPADPDWNDLRYHPGQEQAHANQEPDRGLDHPALVVDAGVLRAHRLCQLRVVGIERLFDLLELTLLVLRKRHCASQEPLRVGKGAMTMPHGARFLPPQYEGGQVVGKSSEKAKRPACAMNSPRHPPDA